MHDFQLFLAETGLSPWLTFALLATLAVGVSLAVHAAIWSVLTRLLHHAPHRLPLRGHLVTNARQPVRWLFVVLALRATLPLLPPSVPQATEAALGQGLYVLLIVVLAWLAVRSARASRLALEARLDLAKADNLSERRVLTQARILQRVVNVGILFVALAAILLNFEYFRNVGAGLLASAGVLGIVLGFAAQRVLGNLLAGIQIAFTQPIRVDDVVIVEGEWGKIEEITLTYVVVQIWDLRRLVLPISYFIEQPFQNWTRTSARLLGTVFVYTDYRVPVDAVRAALGRFVEASEHFDGDVWRLHVTDLKEGTVELRGMMSARDAGAAWDLRCEVREKLLTWLQATYPEALPHTRVLLDPAPDDRAAREASPATTDGAGAHPAGDQDAVQRARR